MRIFLARSIDTLRNEPLDAAIGRTFVLGGTVSVVCAGIAFAARWMGRAHKGHKDRFKGVGMAAPQTRAGEDAGDTAGQRPALQQRAGRAWTCKRWGRNNQAGRLSAPEEAAAVLVDSSRP
ncbi:MAG: hypothetical protein KIS92_20325 [Planctomycetota bacterium]|nr:hypothetical protein [Planctomycetota bacterium]